MAQMIKYIIYSNMLPFFALLFLFILIKHNHLFDKRQSLLFRNVILISMIMLVVISTDAMLSTIRNVPNVWIFRSITSCLNFAAAPLIPLFLYKIFSKSLKFSRIDIPAYFNLALCIISMFTGIIFKISMTNGYARGPLFALPFCISVYYLAVMIVAPNSKINHNRKIEKIFLLFVGISMICGMILELLYRFRFITWDIATISVILYYLLISVVNSQSDSLTGAFNRAMYMKSIAEIDRKRDCVITMIDINNFKQINDTYGHDVGDQYLITMVSILQKYMSSNTILYRIGGDEFTIISKEWTTSYMLEQMNAALTETREQGIDFAYGVSYYTPTTSFEDAEKVADDAMYERKKKIRE